MSEPTPPSPIASAGPPAPVGEDGVPNAQVIDGLLDQASVPLAVKASSISLGAAGLLIALVGLQNLTLVHWLGSWVVIPQLLLGVGAFGIVVAAKLVRGRSWTLAAGLASSLSLAAGGVAMFVLSTLSGILTSLGLLALAAGITALILNILGIGAFRRLITARRRLREAGYDLDL